MNARLLFRSVWWVSNALLILALVATVWSGVWEFSMRQYLKGFSDAILAQAAPPQQKAEAILAWMQNGPPRLEAQHLKELSTRDPQDTLNYKQLLQICGSATNAFLNLTRSAGVESRRLLLLAPNMTAKHVVAELNLDGRWVIRGPHVPDIPEGRPREPADSQGSAKSGHFSTSNGIDSRIPSGIQLPAIRTCAPGRLAIPG